MDVKLVVTGGSHKARVIQLQSAETIIGRQRGCDIRIPSARVSRRHCRLIYRDDCLIVVDLVSANGTYLNDVAVEGQALVRPGDQLSVGPVTFRVEYQLTTNAVLRTQPVDPPSLGDKDEVIKLVEEDPAPSQKKNVPGRSEPSSAGVQEVLGEADGAKVKSDNLAWMPPKPEDVRDILSQLEDE
jgi:pSer/pThr/pTyr-binding forkhead associated (FHA) protein